MLATTQQLELPMANLQALARPEVEPGLSWAERFEAFHQANPHVYRALLDIARGIKRQGWRRASISLLFERLRWLRLIQTRGQDRYKLNNNYQPFYARLLTMEPGLEGFLQTRRQFAHGKASS